jgi:hypothetical protein
MPENRSRGVNIPVYERVVGVYRTGIVVAVCKSTIVVEVYRRVRESREDWYKLEIELCHRQHDYPLS